MYANQLESLLKSPDLISEILTSTGLGKCPALSPLITLVIPGKWCSGHSEKPEVLPLKKSDTHHRPMTGVQESGGGGGYGGRMLNSTWGIRIGQG